MVLVYRILEVLLKLATLFFVIAFERVIGFPVLFLTFAVSFLLFSHSFSRYIIFVGAAFLLAIFYQLAFILSFILLAAFYLGFVLGGQFLESNLNRFLILLSAVIVLIALLASIEIHTFVVVQAIAGVFVSAVFLVKFLFVRYGFLGTKMSSRQSFFK